MLKIRINKLLNKATKDKSTNNIQINNQEMMKDISEKSKKVTKIETYGEVLGTEYFEYFGDFTYYRGNCLYARRVLRKYSYYGEHFYYIKGDYIWRSDKNGSKINVIKKVPNNHNLEIFVNKQGVYLISEKKISLLDFSGLEKACIETCDKIDSYYICDERIYTVVKDEKFDTYIAQWYDTKKDVYHHIYTASENKKKMNSRGECGSYGSRIKHIMANKKRIIMWIEFWNYDYPEDETKLYEIEGAGWYSFDFRTGKMKCINNSCYKLQPHMVLSQPEQLKKYENQMIIENSWISIAMFDMQKDIMWVQKSMNNGEEIWEPRTIEDVSMQKRVSFLPCWKISDKVIGRHYFDGINRFLSTGDHALFSFNEHGEKSNNIYTKQYAGADLFQVCDKYLFYINDEFGKNYQFTKEFLPKEIGKNWMYGFVDNTMSNEEILAVNIYNMHSRPVDEQIESVISVESVNKKNSDKTNGTTRVNVDKEEYWKDFVEYAFKKSGNQEFIDARFPIATPANRNWYALRLGTAKAHIELSFNTQRNSIKTALLIKDRELFDTLEGLLRKNNMINIVLINKESKTMNISIMKNDVDFAGNRMDQYKWFMEGACTFKKLVVAVLK